MAIKWLGFDGTTIAKIDSKYSALRASLRPIDVGALGYYSKGLASGTMAAGLAGAAPIYSFRNSSANKYVLESVKMSMGVLGTGFTAGQITFSLIPARTFTASDSSGTAGTLTGNNGKLDPLFATMGAADVRISATAALSAGTRTLDTDGIETISFPVGTGTSAVLLPQQTPLYEAKAGEHPFNLAQNEGFIIAATVPATGTWCFSVTTKWAEVTAYT